MYGILKSIGAGLSTTASGAQKWHSQNTEEDKMGSSYLGIEVGVEIDMV